MIHCWGAYDLFEDICRESDKRRDGSVAGGGCGVKGEIVEVYLHAADGDDLVEKGNSDTGEKRGMDRSEETSRKGDGTLGPAGKKAWDMVPGPGTGRVPR